MNYTLLIPYNKPLDNLIESHLRAHPDSSVDDALEAIFAAGIRALLITNAERALAERRNTDSEVSA